MDKTYDYDPSGDVTRFIDKVDKDSSYRYIYDELNRVAIADRPMATAKRPSPTTPSATGGIEQRTKSTASPIKISSHPASGLKYDDAGEMTFDGTHSYTYNADGYIASVDQGAVTYTYDAEGNRVSRRVKTADGEAVPEFVWLNGQLLAQRHRTANGSTLSTQNGRRIASTSTHTNEATGNPVADSTTYFLTDTVGLTRVAFSEDGTVLAQGDFAPFGEELRDRTSHHHTRPLKRSQHLLLGRSP